MSSEDIAEVIEDEIKPLDVNIINKEKKETTPYDDSDDPEYDDLSITPEEIEQHDNPEGKKDGKDSSS